MSAVVKLSSKMPGDPETNGFDALRDVLVSEGLGDAEKQLRVALVWFDVQKVTVDTDSDEHVPTIRLRRAEPLGLVGDVDPEIANAVQAAVQRRTGRQPIPFGIVEVSGDGAYGDPAQRTIDDVNEDDE